jgi:hypothetical protein
MRRVRARLRGQSSGDQWTINSNFAQDLINQIPASRLQKVPDGYVEVNRLGLDSRSVHFEVTCVLRL